MYNDDIKKPHASIQIKKVAEAAGMEIGDTVTIHLTGIVKSIESPREEISYRDEGSKTYMRPGSIELEVTKVGLGEATMEDVSDDEK